jgi:hypothetical protein
MNKDTLIDLIMFAAFGTVAGAVIWIAFTAVQSNL